MDAYAVLLTAGCAVRRSVACCPLPCAAPRAAADKHGYCAGRTVRLQLIRFVNALTSGQGGGRARSAREGFQRQSLFTPTNGRGFVRPHMLHDLPDRTATIEAAGRDAPLDDFAIHAVTVEVERYAFGNIIR